MPITRDCLKHQPRPQPPPQASCSNCPHSSTPASAQIRCKCCPDQVAHWLMGLSVGSTSTAAQLAPAQTPPPHPIPTLAFGPVPARLHLWLQLQISESPAELRSNSSSNSSPNSQSGRAQLRLELQFQDWPHLQNASPSSLAAFLGPNPKSAAHCDSHRRRRLRTSSRWRPALPQQAQDDPRRIPVVSAAAQDDPHRILRSHRSSRCPSLRPRSPQHFKMTLTARDVSTAAQGAPRRPAQWRSA